MGGQARTRDSPGEVSADRQDYGQVALGKPWPDTMLPGLISGEMRVKDADRFQREGT